MASVDHRKYTDNAFFEHYNEQLYKFLEQTYQYVEGGYIGVSLKNLNNLMSHVRQMNRLIQIANTSEGGWITVKYYMSDPYDGINKAEMRAMDFFGIPIQHRYFYELADLIQIPSEARNKTVKRSDDMPPKKRRWN